MKTNLRPQHLILLACLLFASFGVLQAQVKNDFDVRYPDNVAGAPQSIRGDITFVANNIVNRETNSLNPEDPYNLTGSSSAYNDLLDMQYIDIDSDPATFSSSSAFLNVPNPSCAKVRYAGLYWSAVYKYNQGDDSSSGRETDFNQVKIRVPGGAYVDLTADEVLFDGFGDADFGGYSPYACYKDITSLITPLTDPNGEYFIANVRASAGGGLPGGISGGWLMVVIYENPNLPGKYITTFDGYAGIKSGETVDIPYNGFTTLPAPFPVRAKLGVGTLEGDNRITGDGLSIRANSNGSFTPLSSAVNPADNFFNSNITYESSIITTRNPNSINTLGWDADLFTITNPSNSVIPNDETGATLRASSTQDKYDIFFNSFDVEIIEPIINLVKTVEDLAGNDIGGTGITLGQELEYVLTFQNVGNDDALNYSIRDVLPVNVNVIDSNPSTPGIQPDITAPNGVTYTFDEAAHEIVFNVPDRLVEEGDPSYEIRLHVKVVENCNDLRDACSNIVQNLAYSTYTGELNNTQITDDPSFSDFDNCGFGTPGTTNFLVDLDNCDFTRTETLCGADLLLEAGTGFLNYEWRDSGGNVLQNGPSNQLTVTSPGTYTVTKTAPAPCLDFDETIIVEFFGATQANPVIPFSDEQATCPNDGDTLPKIFLCGANDSRLIQTGITDFDEIRWEKLDEASCPPIGLEDCANKNSTCTWNTVATGPDFDVSDEGEYRLVIEYQNGCFSRFYFNVFKNPLDPQVEATDIICTSEGEILVTNVPSAGYEFQLVDAGSGAVITGWQTSNSFSIPNSGVYTVQIRQTILNGLGCTFEIPNIGIRERDFQVNVITKDVDCNGLGNIRIQALDVEPQYYYEISQGGSVIDTFGPSDDNDYTFQNLNAGTYDVSVSTDDGCSFTQQVTIIDENDLDLSAHVSQNITCQEGNILVNPSGGKSPYTYTIWSFVPEGGTGGPLYPSVNDIPASAFQTSNIFDIPFGGQGTYEFVVVDRNNCFAISNPVTIYFVPSVDLGTPVITDVTCNGLDNGSITMTILSLNGYKVDFELYAADTNGDATGPILAANDSGVFTGLAPGEYVVRINQTKGNRLCPIDINGLVIAEPDAITGQAEKLSDLSCDPVNPNGQIGIVSGSVSGGTPPYEYSIDGVNFFDETTLGTPPVFTISASGTYTITIRDSNGCTGVTNEIIFDPRNEPTDLTFTFNDVTCLDGQTTDVTVTTTGGTGILTYEIIVPAGTAPTNNDGVFNDLAPGSYTFEVTDERGCSYQETLNIQNVVPIDVIGQLVRNVTCVGDADGEALFTVSGFGSTYSYTINGGTPVTGQSATTIPLTGLAAGDYTIVVTDEVTSCTDTATVTITEPTAPLTIADLSVTDISCNTTGTEPGSVTITASGGWGGFEYELTTPGGATVGPQSNNNFTGLTDTSGSYTVIVRDAGGCEVQDTFTLTPAVAPVLDVTANSLCYDSTTGLILTASVSSGGEAPFQYSLNGGPYQSDPQFTGLGPGSYTITVIDSKNCTGTASIDVFPTLSASAQLVKDLDCSVSPDAEINIDINGGNPSFNYEVLLDGSSFQASTAVPSIPFSFFTTTAGTYEFVITDSQGCTITTNQVVVTDNNPPAVTEVLTHPLCNTSADGVVELQITSGTPPYQIVFNGSAPSSQTTYAGLLAGTYAYTVTDSKGCVANGNVTLVAPNPIIPGAITVVQDYRCDTSSATLQATGYSGGTPPYEFSIDGVNFQSSDTFTGLLDGTYTITIRDDNGCTDVTAPVTIDPLNEPTDLSFVATAPTCPAIVSDVTVTVTGGNAPFVFEIIAPAGSAVNNGNTPTFNGLAPGTYTFRVTDDKGCTIQENFTIQEIPEIAVISQLVSNVTCVGDTDGELSFTVSDFATTYSYVVTNSGGAVIQSQNNINTTTAITVTNLAAETYTITVTDDTTNCTASSDTIIQEPSNPLDFTFTNTPVTCIANASITVNATGGWGNYQYQLVETSGPTTVYPYQGSNVFTDVPDGTYEIYVRDGGGCEIIKPLVIDPAVAPTIAFDPASDLCYDDTNSASLTISITDGVAPYTYSINGGAQQPVSGNPFTISGLIPGTYNIAVTDAYGCVSNTLTQTIEQQLVASAVLTKDLDCTVSPDAVITVSVNGGYTPYASYEVSTDGGVTFGAPVAFAGASFTYNTASDGTYLFQITDAQGCTTTTQATVNPISNPSITSLVQLQDILCNGDPGATIQVNIDPAFGTAPFTISVVNTTTSTNYGSQTSGLPAGTYEVTVTDAKSCTDTEIIVINEPDAIVYSTTKVDITCNNPGGTSFGEITIENLSGGTAGYTYYLTNNFDATVQTYTAAAGEDHTFVVLNFGIYTIDVVDANGCSNRQQVTMASPPSDLIIDVTTVTTNCATGGTAVVTVTSLVGSNNYEFGILETNIPPYTSSWQPADAGFPDQSTFTGLTPGVTYTFVVHDLTTDCYFFKTADAPIDTPSNLTSVLDAVNNVSCTGSADGNVTFSIDNFDAGATSVSYEIFSAQSNVSTGITGSVAVNPPAGPVTEPNVGPLPVGIYYILFTENGGAYNGCTSASPQFNIEESTNLLNVTPTVIKNDNCNLNAGEIVAVGQYGTPPYEYQIALNTDPAPTVATWAGSSANVFNVEGGDYIVYIKDANNCIQQNPVSLPTDPSPEITASINDQCTALEGQYTVDITLDALGIPPYSISLDGGAPQAAGALVNIGDVLTFSNLSSGVHTFQLFDANGCGEPAETITIHPPLGIQANITAEELCNPINSGEITVTANGGSGNYSYTLVNTGATNTTGVFGGLTHSVTYTFQVTDTTTGCDSGTVDVVIPAPQNPSFTLIPTHVSCFGGNDGTITVTLDAGNTDTPYEYSIGFSGTRQTSNVFTGLSADTYSIYVFSSKGCFSTQDVTINQPTQLDISASASSFTCDDDASTITVTVNNDGGGNPSGTGPYMYSFDGGLNFQPGNTIQVPFGSPDVNVVVQDANSCQDNVTVSVPAPQEVTAGIVQLQAIDCVNGEEIIQLNATGGSGDYSYIELPGGTAIPNPANIVITAPGTYVYEVTDNITNCSVIVEHTIDPYDLIDVVASVITDADCSDSSDGQLQIVISGYTGTFNYQVLDINGNFVAGASGSGNATADPFSFPIPNLLPAGSYSVQVTETAFPECTDTSNTVTIDAPEPLSLEPLDNVNANCNEPNAIVTVQAYGGTAPYNYGASPSGSGVPATFPFDNTIELDPTVSLNWDIYVQDANGCIIDAPLAVTVATDTTPDITLAIDDVCAADGSFAITVSLDAVNTGVAPYTLSINGGAFQSIGSLPYTYTGLNAGAYSIEIRDANNCGEVENITIDQELEVTAVVISQPTCNANDGVIEFTATGGSGNYTVELLRPDFSNTGIAPTGNQFVGVPFGDYIVRVNDNVLGTPNCFEDAAISLEEPTPVTLLTTDKTDVSCQGASDGSITINLETPGPGVNDNPPYTFEITGPVTVTQNTNVFTGLPAGTYDITVTSNRNCVATDQITINEPVALDASVTNTTSFSCNADNGMVTAEIEVTITPGTGTPDYFYSVNGGSFLPVGTGLNVFTYTVVADGNYDIVIQDANNCSVVLPTVVIDPLPRMTLDVINVTDIDCANGAETFTIDVTGHSTTPATDLTFEVIETGDIQANVNVAQATFNLANPGTYTIQVTDNVTGCYEFISHTVDVFDTLEVNAAPENPVSCYGGNDGSLTLTVNGYSGTYSYDVIQIDVNGNEISPAIATGTDDTANGTISISGLSGGNYLVRVTAGTVCEDDSNIVTIASPNAPLSVTVENAGDVSCDGDTGRILVTPAGGWPPYDIVLTNTDNGNTQSVTAVTGHVFTNLPAGNYTVDVVDSVNGGCSANGAINLPAPTPPTATISPDVALNCVGDSNGSLTATASGGSGNYTYQLNSYEADGVTLIYTTDYQSVDTFNNLVPGIYSITVTDALNCTVETAQRTITEPGDLTANLALASAQNCAGEADLEITASGGTGNYTYELFAVTLDGNGNEIQTTYATGTFSGNVVINNVPTGNYRAYVGEDNAFNCDPVETNQVGIDEIPPLQLTLDPSGAFVNCNGDSSGVILAEAVGGLGGYTFELYDVDPASNPSAVAIETNAQGTFTGYPVGTYYVQVRSGDCPPVSQQIVIDEPEPIVIVESFTNPTCPGENNGTITVTGTGGVGPMLYAIATPTQPDFLEISEKNSWEDLAPGEYRVLVQDQLGCRPEVRIFNIVDPLPINVSLVSKTDVVCEGDSDGSIEIAVTGGADPGTGPYYTSLNSTDDANFVEGKFLYDNLPAGTHVIFVKDANGCQVSFIETVEAGVTINAQADIEYGCNVNIPYNRVDVTVDPSVVNDVMYALDPTDPNDLAQYQIDPFFNDVAGGAHTIYVVHTNGCIDSVDINVDTNDGPLTLTAIDGNYNQIVATANGGYGNYTFYFNGVNNGSDNTYTIRETGTYTVTVIDSGGCEVSVDIFMEFIDIQIPNYFTPDGDTVNDTWYPKNREAFPNMVSRVYDRYGRLVAELRGSEVWDGRYDGKELPSGDYWYVVKLKGEEDPREFIGNVTLYR